MKKRINPRKKMEELKFENELKKIKLSLEHGAEFINPSGDNIPAKIEREFLNYVEQFEIAYKNSKRIQVYEFIGRPEYKALSTIHISSISSELDELLDMLWENQIVVDTISGVDDTEMYRFITEELFFEETDDIRIEGMMHNFIYEEFHPNHDYDIRETCTELIEDIFNKETEFDTGCFELATEIDMIYMVLRKADFIKKLNDFRDSFSSIDLVNFTITSVLIEKAKADVLFETEYSLTIEGAREVLCYSGKGEFGLIKEFEFWSVNRINIPGLNF